MNVRRAHRLIVHLDDVAMTTRIPLLVLVAVLQRAHILAVTSAMDTRQLFQIVVHILRCPEVLKDGLHVLLVAMSARIGQLALESMAALDTHVPLI